MTSDDDGWGKAVNFSSTEDKATVSGSTRVVMHWGGPPESQYLCSREALI